MHAHWARRHFLTDSSPDSRNRGMPWVGGIGEERKPIVLLLPSYSHSYPTQAKWGRFPLLVDGETALVVAARRPALASGCASGPGLRHVPVRSRSPTQLGLRVRSPNCGLSV